MPCVCVGCAVNLSQLINPALLHSPQALSTVSATLHNHPTQGREVQSRPVGRATLVLGTRPPYTPLQLCLELDMQRRDEKLALARFLHHIPDFFFFKYIYDCQQLQTWFYHAAVLHSVITLLLIEAHFSMIALHYVLDKNVCHVYFPRYEAQSLNQS